MKNTPISLDAVVCRNDDRFLSNALGDELVMMDQETGDYININSVGADIWNMLSEPLTISELLNKTVSTYDITAEQATAPVFDFVKHMYEQNIVLIQKQSA